MFRLVLLFRMVLLFGMTLLVGLIPLNTFAQEDYDKREVDSFLTQLFVDRNAFLVNRLPESINKYYIHTEKVSSYAYQMELRRGKYINTWADKRGIRLIGAEPTIRITRFKKDGDVAYVSLIQMAKISYDYNTVYLPPQSFGVGTRHALTLKKIDGNWMVLKEWYLDPLEENSELIADSPVGFPHLSPDNETSQNKGRYNRERAVAYANKYAGLAWGAGNNNRYNSKYKDYTPLGGDCTNFVSQVLGDKEEGGGLQKTRNWRSGSKAWVQTDAFEHFLLNSGYGRLIAKGTFTEVTDSSDKHPHGAISRLKPGDVIGYTLDGDTDHFSVVVGQDANGYPLVNSHTADRYRVPFDLGWDKTTKYILIHIND